MNGGHRGCLFVTDQMVAPLFTTSIVTLVFSMYSNSLLITLFDACHLGFSEPMRLLLCLLAFIFLVAIYFKHVLKGKSQHPRPNASTVESLRGNVANTSVATQEERAFLEQFFLKRRIDNVTNAILKQYKKILKLQTMADRGKNLDEWLHRKSGKLFHPMEALQNLRGKLKVFEWVELLVHFAESKNKNVLSWTAHAKEQLGSICNEPNLLPTIFQDHPKLSLSVLQIVDRIKGNDALFQKWFLSVSTNTQFSPEALYELLNLSATKTLSILKLFTELQTLEATRTGAEEMLTFMSSNKAISQKLLSEWQKENKHENLVTFWRILPLSQTAGFTSSIFTLWLEAYGKFSRKTNFLAQDMCFHQLLEEVHFYPVDHGQAVTNPAANLALFLEIDDKQALEKYQTYAKINFWLSGCNDDRYRKTLFNYLIYGSRTHPDTFAFWIGIHQFGSSALATLELRSVSVWLKYILYYNEIHKTDRLISKLSKGEIAATLIHYTKRPKEKVIKMLLEVASNKNENPDVCELVNAVILFIIDSKNNAHVGTSRDAALYPANGLEPISSTRM
ncbi:hypothetical protein CCR75_002599 [Bremia lactucae]|uniref:Uncharacterized protein n=1 Tax=Bremia lactucae TaxID=4779 RepID=A0A976ILQ3_BRELC|nr:hypothetical protein CCR75_002599 [Bremia lactucae]